MKFLGAVLCLLIVVSSLAAAQSNNIPQVQHVILVIQENRTPDNLFNQDLVLAQAGGDVQPPNNQGPCKLRDKVVNITMQPTLLWTCWDSEHNHLQPTSDWVTTWDHGHMDGACHAGVAHPHCDHKIHCPPANPDEFCPAYTYAENYLVDSGQKKHILDPYFFLAEHYGWANNMFQTNQGSSFPAHLFLLSGTSAPEAPNNDLCGKDYYCYQWFDAENYTAPNGWGCNSSSANLWEIDPSGKEYQGIYNGGYPCYDHATLVDLLDNAQPAPVTWKYYAREADGLWTAPNAIRGICVPDASPTPKCTGSDWLKNVAAVLPDQGGYDGAPILDDIENCKLSNVSWVIPDGNWSDHVGIQNGPPGDGGPSWVAAIVNAVAKAQNCDAAGYWADTVILVTWDDWGGYYDHVPPPNCGPGQSCGYPNGTGAEFVYGFRVPLLVVSAYSLQSARMGAAYSGYISNIPHDFGSILNFVEYAFGTNGKPLGYPGGISPNYPYADYFAPDTAPGGGTDPYGLSDFFNFSQNPLPPPHITSWKYIPDCFHQPSRKGCFKSYPADPDNDAND